MPNWTKKALDTYLSLLDFTSGKIFRAMYCDGTIRRETLRPNSLWKIVKQYAAKSDLPEISPHDLRRTYAKLAYKNGAKLDQIQINLGHQSLTTTQKYLGLELDLNDGPGSYLDIRI
jgi:integrase